MFRIGFAVMEGGNAPLSLDIVPLLFLGQCLGGSTPGAPSPVESRRITISSMPVLLDTSDPSRVRVGALTFLGGWNLKSDARSFGGLSALDVNGNRVTAISDIGAGCPVSPGPIRPCVGCRYPPRARWLWPGRPQDR